MSVKPSQKQIKSYLNHSQYNIIPISFEIKNPSFTPLTVMKKLKNISTHCFLFESFGNSSSKDRYTFLGFEPKQIITAKGSEIYIDGVRTQTSNPANEIRQILAKYKSIKFDHLPPFTGGLVGYFSYDYLSYKEPTLINRIPDSEKFNDVDLMLFDKVIAFDNTENKIMIIVNMNVSEGIIGYNRAVFELCQISQLIQNGAEFEENEGKLLSEIKPMFTKEQYCSMVEKAKEHIYEGDIFQIVLSNCLSADFKGSLLNTYQILRDLNPSPYMFYLSGTDVEIAGASPETLVKLEDGILRTFPLAGTRKRGKDKESDEMLEKELLSDEKELAEHNMLVDLGRNDLGKISKFGTVEVEKLHSIERFSHVMHIGSTVKGEIREDCDALDAVDAVLPAGTLSGAPKIRACQLISELEQDKRGIYGGGIGYIDFNGNLDLCIAIRIAYSKNGKVFVRSGAGIVADSDPEKEYQECINKAAAVMDSLKNKGGNTK